MLISCFQCRQQLEVPDDSAGKRVRCPHCQYVIVVPAAQRPLSQTELGEEPASEAPLPMLALPSLELDEGEKPVQTKVSPQPLPPVSAPAPVDKPRKKSDADLDDLPPPPPIDRRARRRAPMTPLPSRFPWGKVLGIGAVVGVIVIGVIIGIVSSHSNRRRHQPPKMVFNPPLNGQQMPPIQIQPPGFPNQGMPPFAIQQQLVGNWREFQDRNRRFKAQFPGVPAKRLQNINFTAMTVFETQQQEWAFSVAHAVIPDNKLPANAEVDRFNRLRAALANLYAANFNFEQALPLAGGQSGREWQAFLPNFNNRPLFVRAFFAREGKTIHHYLLIARGPMNVNRNHPDIAHFFNSFQMLIGLETSAGESIHELVDDLQNDGRREEEFTALALHPNLPLAVLGSASGSFTVVDAKQQITVPVRAGHPIRDAALSADGVWLALAFDDEVRLSRQWRNVLQPAFAAPLKGNACIFTKDRRLLVASQNEVIVHQCDPKAVKPVDRFATGDLAIRGLALSADEKTLAVWGENAIELWQWRGKKKLVRIDAHDAPITAVAIAPDNQTLASASTDRTIKLWDAPTGKERATLKQHAWTPWALAFTPNGKHLASGGLDGMLLLWDLQPRQPQLAWAQAYQFPVRALTFDKQGAHCYVTCKHAVTHPQGIGRQWARQLRKIAWKDIKLDPQTAQKAESLLAQRAGLYLPVPAGGAHLSPDGKFIVTTTLDELNKPADRGTLRVWDADTATVRYSLPARPGGQFSPDGKWFVFASPGQRISLHLLEVASGQVQPGVVRLDAAFIPPIVFTPEGKAMWALNKHELIRLDVPTLAEKGRVRLKNPNDPRFIAIHLAEDHRTFLAERRPVAGGVRQRTLHDSADGKQLPLPKEAPGGWSAYVRLAVTPDGLVEMQDSLIGFSRVIGQQRTRGFGGAMQPTRKYGVTNESGPNQIPLKFHLWDLEERRPVLTLLEHEANFSAWMRFSDDGGSLALATSNGWTRVIPMEWLIDRKDRLPIDPNDVAAP